MITVHLIMHLFQIHIMIHGGEQTIKTMVF